MKKYNHSPLPKDFGRFSLPMNFKESTDIGYHYVFCGMNFTHPTPKCRYVKILKALDEHGYLRTFELEHAHGCMSFSSYLARMHKFGLLRRYINDKRHVLWTITAKGQHILRQATLEVKC